MVRMGVIRISVLAGGHAADDRFVSSESWPGMIGQYGGEHVDTVTPYNAALQARQYR